MADRRVGAPAPVEVAVLVPELAGLARTAVRFRPTPGASGVGTSSVSTASSRCCSRDRSQHPTGEFWGSSGAGMAWAVRAWPGRSLGDACAVGPMNASIC